MQDLLGFCVWVNFSASVIQIAADGLKPGLFSSVLAKARPFQLFDGSIQEAKFLFNRLFSLCKIRELAFPHPPLARPCCLQFKHIH